MWSVPWFTEARTIYYRKDVYKRAGVNPQTAFKTWASFRAALLKLRSVRSVNGKPIMPFGQPGKTAGTSCTTSCRSSGAPAAPS